VGVGKGEWGETHDDPLGFVSCTIVLQCYCLCCSSSSAHSDILFRLCNHKKVWSRYLTHMVKCSHCSIVLSHYSLDDRPTYDSVPWVPGRETFGGDSSRAVRDPSRFSSVCCFLLLSRVTLGKRHDVTLSVTRLTIDTLDVHDTVRYSLAVMPTATSVLRASLEKHNETFETLLSLIPAKFYLPRDDNNDQVGPLSRSSGHTNPSATGYIQVPQE